MMSLCVSAVCLKVLHACDMLCKSLTKGKIILTHQPEDTWKTDQRYANFRFMSHFITNLLYIHV